MFESFILGAVQGIAEWLPISSEAMIVLVKQNFFSSTSFQQDVHYAIFLHLGTLLAAILYFRKTIVLYLKQVIAYNKTSSEQRRELWFIVITSMISGIVGYLILQVLPLIEPWFENTSLVNMLIGVLLLVTALLLYLSEQNTNKNDKATLKSHCPNRGDAIVTGLAQSCAALPGISRSGTTLAAMGLRGFKKDKALELSFILSIPLVLFANIIINSARITTITSYDALALLSSFIFGIATIHLLLRLVRSIRFSTFVGLFAFLLLLFAVLV